MCFWDIRRYIRLGHDREQVSLLAQAHLRRPCLDLVVTNYSDPQQILLVPPRPHIHGAVHVFRTKRLCRRQIRPRLQYQWMSGIVQAAPENVGLINANFGAEDLTNIRKHCFAQ